MNFFEKELRKLFENSPVMDDIRFAGRVCVGRLNEAISVKLEFVTLGSADHYEGIKTTVINRDGGKMDSAVFRFEDIPGKKTVTDPNFKEGIAPHFWKGGRDYGWSVYKPSPADYERLSEAAGNYLEIFQEPIQSQSMGQQMR